MASRVLAILKEWESGWHPKWQREKFAAQVFKLRLERRIDAMERLYYKRGYFYRGKHPWWAWAPSHERALANAISERFNFCHVCGDRNPRPLECDKTACREFKKTERSEKFWKSKQGRAIRDWDWDARKAAIAALTLRRVANEQRRSNNRRPDENASRRAGSAHAQEDHAQQG